MDDFDEYQQDAERISRQLNAGPSWGWMLLTIAVIVLLVWFLSG